MLIKNAKPKVKKKNDNSYKLYPKYNLYFAIFKFNFKEII